MGIAVAVALTLVTVNVSAAEVVIPANAGNQPMSQQDESVKGLDSHFRGNDKKIVQEKKIDVKKGLVAFVEISTSEPTSVYLMYPSQFEKYKASGSPEGALEFKAISWLFYPVPALLEDQTVYIVPKGDVTFNVTYENIQERIDRLFAGEEQLRAGTEMLIESGVNIVRLTPLIPGLKVRLDFFEKKQFVVIKTIDLARYKKGLKSFDQLYDEYDLKGSYDHVNFSTSDFEDLYLLIKTDNQIKLKYMIWATKESAESGC